MKQRCRTHRGYLWGQGGCRIEGPGEQRRVQRALLIMALFAFLLTKVRNLGSLSFFLCLYERCQLLHSDAGPGIAPIWVH